MTETAGSASERWKRITQVTADALARPTAGRAAWLEETCAGDESLRAEVESLLEADARSGEFLETSAIAADGAAEAVEAVTRASFGLSAGRHIGPYRIVRELGQGGMGTVYLAARADLAFDKDVAIKVVRQGLASGALLERFLDERRILATLDHPNIARLLDAGTTAEGLSYLVMEYVEGEPLDVFASDGRLPLSRRLQLFQQVCAAVQYAHQHLVIHRDLKARNILVTPTGTPKLLDFGIARLLDHGLTHGQTQTGLRAFTIDNASPEQLRGEPMTVTSDVYSLGVLLYRLTTGQSPYGTQHLTDVALMRAICEDPPNRPRLSAPAGTGFEISLELEYVVLKALRKEPSRRYESVEQLAGDIGRLLSGRPVLAAPDSVRYRTRKFVSRHRLSVAAGLLAVASLLAGLTTTLWQARRAEAERAQAQRRFATVRRLANSMVFELNDALEAGGTAARALLLTRASEQLDALAVDAPDDPALAEELATAYHRLGDVQGLTGSAHLGDAAAGLANHRKGLAIRRTQAARAPRDLETRLRLVNSLISTAYAEDQIGPSLEHARAAVSSAESLVASRPQEARFQRVLASAHYALGSQYRAIGDTPEAAESFMKATPLLQTLYDRTPGDDGIRRELALCHKRLGAILVDQQQVPAALEHLVIAVDLDTASLAARPQDRQRRRDLSTSNTQLGLALFSHGDPAGSLAAHRRALEIRERLMQDDPANMQAPWDVASGLRYVGFAEQAAGHPAAALAAFERAVPLARRPGSDRDDLSALILSGQADVYESTRRWPEALHARRQSLQQHRVLLVGQPAIKTLRRAVVIDAIALGDLLMTLADRDSAGRDARSREACGIYREGEAVILAASDRGRTESLDSDVADTLRQRLARCAGHGSAQIVP